MATIANDIRKSVIIPTNNTKNDHTRAVKVNHSIITR